MKKLPRRTLPAASGVKNLGQSARVTGVHLGGAGAGVGGSRRSLRSSLPSACQIMRLLSLAVVPEERKDFRRRFRNARRDQVLVREEERPRGSDKFLCGRTAMAVVGTAFECVPVQLCSADGMFPETGSTSNYLNEFYVMDVILNRRSQQVVGDDGVINNGGRSGASDPRIDVCPVSCVEGDLGDESDQLFRAAILFLPQCGVFYCSRDRHLGDAGLPGTFRAYDMSWLGLEKTDGGVAFGVNSYVKRFNTDYESLDDCAKSVGHGLGAPYRRVSAWRISLGFLHPACQKRVVYRAVQTRDDELPLLAPDFIAGNDYRSVPHEYRAHDYRSRLEASNSAREGCRWYVPGSLHCNVPTDCLIIDPMSENFVDIFAQIDGIPCRHSVVSIRYIPKVSNGQDRDRSDMLHNILEHCQRFRQSAPRRGAVRANSSDLGAMIPIGTRIVEAGVDGAGDPVHVKTGYAANAYYSGEGGLQHVVDDLARVGIACFPQVHAVIRDTEQNSGLSPVSGMDGMLRERDPFLFGVIGATRSDIESADGKGDVDADDTVAGSADDDGGEDTNERCGDDDNDDDDDDDDDDDNNDDDNDEEEDDDEGDDEPNDYIPKVGEDYFKIAGKWAAAQAQLASGHRSSVRRKLRRLIANLERRRRVGYTIDLSFNLGNSSHYDVNDASQAYSVWLEDCPGKGTNWYFILPNLCGVRPDGTPFSGVAVKLGYGVAISWDGRVVRHCTSVSKPDGDQNGFVDGNKKFKNTLYGMFTAAKEKIVRAGRTGCSIHYIPRPRTDSSKVDNTKRKRQQRNKKNKKKQRLTSVMHVDLSDTTCLFI